MKTETADTPELRAAEAAWHRANERLSAAFNRGASQRSMAAYLGQVNRTHAAMIAAAKPRA